MSPLTFLLSDIDELVDADSLTMIETTKDRDDFLMRLRRGIVLSQESASAQAKKALQQQMETLGELAEDDKLQEGPFKLLADQTQQVFQSIDGANHDVAQGAEGVALLLKLLFAKIASGTVHRRVLAQREAISGDFALAMMRAELHASEQQLASERKSFQLFKSSTMDALDALRAVLAEAKNRVAKAESLVAASCLTRTPGSARAARDALPLAQAFVVPTAAATAKGTMTAGKARGRGTALAKRALELGDAQVAKRARQCATPPPL